MAVREHSAKPDKPAPLLLALDQGGHASRALVFDMQGRQITQAYAAIGTQRPSVDRVEHDARELLDSMHMVIAAVAHTLGSDATRLHAAGMATQRSSIVCWDAYSGAPLSPVLSWQDRRNAALTAQLEPHRDAIQRLTGLVLSPHYGASKLRWCLDELPQVQHALAAIRLHCGPLASYLLQGLLTQSPGHASNQRINLVDPANASRTQLWSPASRDWSQPLLEWFGIPREVLPRSVATQYTYGSLNIAGHAVPLLVCTGDQAAVPFAQGALQNDTIYLNLGTGAFALAPLEHDIQDIAPLLRSVLWSDEHEVRYALEGTVNGASSALHWLAERSGVDVERAAQALNHTQVTQLNMPIFINGIGGIGSPYWLPHIESRFVDEAGSYTSEAEVAAVIESIAFLITANLMAMRDRAPHLTRIVAGGGLASCNYLCACISALNQLPLTRLSEAELTAKGLAFLIAAQPRDWLQDGQPSEFVPLADAKLTARYKAWSRYMSELHESRAPA